MAYVSVESLYLMRKGTGGLRQPVPPCPPKPCDCAAWPRDVAIWKCEGAKMPWVKPLRISPKAQVALCVWGLGEGGVLLLVFVLIGSPNCTSVVLYWEGFDILGLTATLVRTNTQRKTGKSRFIWAFLSPTHQLYFSVKLWFSSVFVFFHCMVNLIEDERALRSCSTTVTSLSVSSSAGNGVLPSNLLLFWRSPVRVLSRGGLRVIPSVSLCQAQSLHVGIQGVAKNDVYL